MHRRGGEGGGELATASQLQRAAHERGLWIFGVKAKKLSHGSQAINNIPFPMLFARRIPLVFFVFLSRDFIFNCTQSKQKRTGESQRRDGTGKKRQNKSQTIYSNLLSFPSGDLHEKIRQKLYANFGWMCAE
jgi:hypothetical protein